MSDFPSVDKLIELAQDNPDELERIRQEQIELLINAAPEQHQRRLRGLQFQIDAQRQLHADSPMGSCLSISKMMHQSFAELRLSLNQLSGFNDPLLGDLADHGFEETTTADVLPFPG